jgi:CBS domain-containing protein
VYDYVPGKEDWLARGLPTEGEKADAPRVWKLARKDVVTCALDDTVGDVRERILASPYGFGFVVSGSGCVLGRMRKSELDCDPSLTAEQVMEPGPSTVRADLSPDELRERLDKKGFSYAVVTTPDGKLIGVVARADLGE